MNIPNNDKDWFEGENFPYPRFEALVLRLLSKYLEAQQKSLHEQVRVSRFRADGVAPDGIDNLPGPTLIEVKLWRRPITADAPRFTQTLSTVHTVAQEGRFRSVLLVVGKRLTSDERRHISEATAFWMHFSILVWDLSDLRPLLQQYAEYVSDLLPEVGEVAVSNVVKKSARARPDHWKYAREQHIEKLKVAHSQKDLVLFLGAGVSMSAGVPNWKALLSKLFLAMTERQLPKATGALAATKDEQQFIAEFQQLQQAFPLVGARHLRNGLGESFEQQIADALYEGVRKRSVSSPLLLAISRLCVPGNIQAIVTYNFDDLVEKQLESTGMWIRPVYTDAEAPSSGELGVYHVHGFLPQEAERYDGVADSLLVFSEEGYHSVLSAPFFWSNIVQMNFLRERTCLLIGFSLTDPNQRRLLDAAARKGNPPKHYIIRPRLSSQPVLDSAKEHGVPLRPEIVQEFLSVHHGLVEKSDRDLGLNVVWVEDHDEIPAVLDLVRAHPR